MQLVSLPPSRIGCVVHSCFHKLADINQADDRTGDRRYLLVAICRAIPVPGNQGPTGVRPSSNRQLGRRRHRIYRPIGRELRWRSVVACALSRMANSQRVPRCSYETALETFVLQMSYPSSRLQTRVPAIHGANPIAFLRERNSFYSPHAYEHMLGRSTSDSWSPRKLQALARRRTSTFPLRPHRNSVSHYRTTRQRDSRMSAKACG